MKEMDIVRWSRNKKRGEKKGGRVKGTNWRRGKEMNQKGDRSGGYR